MKQPAAEQTARSTRRSLLALAALTFFVGTGLVYWLASADGLRAGPSQVDHSRSSGFLHDHSTIGQIFHVQPQELRGLRLWVLRPLQGSSGSLTLRLRDLDHGRDIATAQIDVARLSTEGPTDFIFTTLDPAPDSEQAPVTVELTSLTAGVTQANQLTFLGSSNRYSNGILIRNGKQVAREDLAFEALYAGRKVDQIIPVTQLALARPGIFGWPPLYALLPWLFIYAAGWLLVSLASTVRSNTA